MMVVEGVLEGFFWYLRDCVIDDNDMVEGGREGGRGGGRE